MSTYIRGPICGTDNCPSRLYRILNGYRTCQYGHVMDGDVEFNDEDDIAQGPGSVTRRLNLTTNATGNFVGVSRSQNTNIENIDKKVYGTAGRHIFLQGFQFILKKQCDWLSIKLGYNKNIEKRVKILWTMLLTTLDDNSGINISLISSVCLLLIACTQMYVPIYTCDILKWIINGDLLYYKANLKIPNHLREKMPNYYLKQLEGGTVPSDGQIQNHLIHLLDRINYKKYFNELNFSYRPLLLRLVLENTLPIEFFYYTVYSIEDFQSNDKLIFKTVSIKDKKKIQRFEDYHPEYLTICKFILSVQEFLYADEEIYDINYLNKLLLIFQDLNLSIPQRAVQKERDVFDWSTEETTDYLDWIESQFIPMQGEFEGTIDEKIAKKKLYRMIPLPPSTSTSSNDTQSKDYIDSIRTSYEKFRSSEAVNENDQIKNRKKVVATISNTITHHISKQFGIKEETLEDSLTNLRLKSKSISKQTSG